jgi:hypothetical protein
MTATQFRAGDRVEIAETERDGDLIAGGFGTVDRDHGGENVFVEIDGDRYAYPHQVPAIPRELLTLLESDEDGDGLADLIAEHGIKITPIYVGSFNGSPTRQHDYDIYDVVLTIVTDTNMYGGDDNPAMRTMLYRGYGQSYANSLPQNGGCLVLPTVDEVLTDLLSEASNADAWDTAEEWAADMSVSGTPLEIKTRFAGITVLRDELRTFLGDDYDKFVEAAQAL